MSPVHRDLPVSRIHLMRLLGLCLVIIVMLGVCVAPTMLLTAPFEVPTSLPIALLTPKKSPTAAIARVPIRVEDPSVGFAAVVTITAGTSDRMGIPTLTAGYWSGSPGLGEGGNTVIVGFQAPGIFDHLSATQPGDILLVTDQNGLTTSYRVVEVSTIDDMKAAAQATTVERLTLIGISPSGVAFLKVVATAVDDS
jgi:Sortase domain